jgi:hypothetical protein
MERQYFDWDHPDLAVYGGIRFETGGHTIPLKMNRKSIIDRITLNGKKLREPLLSSCVAGFDPDQVEPVVILHRGVPGFTGAKRRVTTELNYVVFGGDAK